MAVKSDRYEFIWKAIQKHGYKYDYRKVEYKNSKEKVCIICPEHGEFWQMPDSHLHNKGCVGCKNDKFRQYNIYTSCECAKNFIEKAKEAHGDKYDYSKVEYKNSKEKVCIICFEHGEFWQSPNDHLMGHGCPICKNIDTGNNKRKTLSDFINESNIIHNNKYNYSKVNYINSHTKICIICPIHGEFQQKPYHHTNSVGCPICNESKLEKEISQLLDDNNITYERQKRFPWLGRQSLDFYLPDYNIGIECQGRQHFEPVDYFGGEKSLKKEKLRDEKKYNLCKENNLKLLYYGDKKHCNELLNKEELIEKIYE